MIYNFMQKHASLFRWIHQDGTTTNEDFNNHFSPPMDPSSFLPGSCAMANLKTFENGVGMELIREDCGTPKKYLCQTPSLVDIPTGILI